jgi:hypothetical protein
MDAQSFSEPNCEFRRVRSVLGMEPLMKALQKFLFIVAVSIATSTAIQSASAQSTDRADAIQSTMEDAVVKEMGVQPKPSSAAAQSTLSGAGSHDKADAAMTTPHSLPNEADRNAARAMSKK